MVPSTPVGMANYTPDIAHRKLFRRFQAKVDGIHCRPNQLPGQQDTLHLTDLNWSFITNCLLNNGMYDAA